MLAVDPNYIKEDYPDSLASKPVRKKGHAKLVTNLATFLRKCGLKETGEDLLHLAETLAWVSDPEMKPYMGDPVKATKEAGEAMLKARLDDAIELFEKALRGEKVQIRPLLWSLRVLRKLPE
jgi:creatinine amidohydrolase/Fe(II)-dependent formamide hydrolase-like protein